VKVSTRDNGEMWSGSGVIFKVADGQAYILTNKHVAPRAGLTYVVYPYGGNPVRATFLAADPAHDLACLVIPATRGMVYVPLAQTSDTQGYSVWQIGYPHAGRLRYQYFAYVGRAGGNGHPVHLRFNRPVQSGESGSGVLHYGKLIGIVWGASATGWGNPESETYAVPVEAIHVFVNTYCFRRPILGINIGNRTPAPAPPAVVVPQPPTSLPGPPGPEGPPGPQGPAGPAGQDADPAALQGLKQQLGLLTQQVGQLQAMVSNLQGSIRVQVTPVQP
jgi:S1-C subfamily serine protease